MYKILTQIHLNYKFKKITFKNIQIHGLSDCLAKRCKCDEMHLRWVFTVETAVILLKNVFEFTFNEARRF